MTIRTRSLLLVPALALATLTFAMPARAVVELLPAANGYGSHSKSSGPDQWAMKGRDMQHTGRADYSVPDTRLGSSFFDIFLWQKPSPGSPTDGPLSSTSMVFFDGVGPDQRDIVAAGYHWPKGVQGMDRHTGSLLWNGLPRGGESIGARSPAFSNDGLTLYVTNDATQSEEWPNGHPLMAFSSLDGPAVYRHNGEDAQPGDLEMDSPTIAADGRIFLHSWVGRPRAATDDGVALIRTWEAATHAECGHGDPALHPRDDDTLLVYVGDRNGVMHGYDANTGAELWTATMPGTIDATGTIDPVNGNIYQPLGDPSIYVAGHNAYGQPLWSFPDASLIYEYQSGVNDPERAQSAGCLSWDGATFYFQTVSSAATGKLYAVNTADGSLKWTYATGSQQQDENAASPIITRNGVIIVGNNDHTYFAIRDEGAQGTLLDSFDVDSNGQAKASPTLSSDGMLYLPLRTTWISTNGDGDLPSGQVENLFSAFDLTENAQAMLAPPPSQRAFALNASVRLEWQPVADPTAVFDHYAVYRDTQAFSNVLGMTPVATVHDRLTTIFDDDRAVNGTRYDYAVTTVAAGGGEITSIASIGPRTPRDETDLQVASLARTPRFPRYDPQYSWYEITEESGYGPYGFSAATGLGSGQDAFTQRWPLIGDPVTWTATVRNRGTNQVTGPLNYTWEVDGTAVSSGSVSLDTAPGDTAEVSFVSPWDGVQHEVTFLIAPVDDARAGNNQLRAWTKSVAFLSYIDKTRLETFREETPDYPMAASDDLIDWLNRHMERFNAMFADAGSAKRVHFDILDVLPDDAPDPDVPRIDFAIFPFRYMESEGSVRLSGYYDPTEDLDYGLLHEMGHQLGMIDIYRLNMGPDQNLVSGSGYSAPECLMNGCSHVLSEHSARAMDHWQDVAHGYYGQYLYNLPETMRLKLLGQDGLPLVGATVRIYQKCERSGLGEVIIDQVKAIGVTDGDGMYILPNVPIDTTLVPTVLTGDRLRPNPFGYVAVVGTNGVLLCEVEHAGFVDYCWLDITEANNAYWRGDTAMATFERQVSLGGSVEGEPPLDMAELNADQWSAWAQDGTITPSDDTDRVQVGQGSVRVHATGGFDNYARYPGNHLTRWNLSDTQSLHIWCYAENPNGGFQERSPWFRLRSRDGYIDLKPYWDILNDAMGNWLEFIIPLAGDATWERIEHGTPDLTRIQGLDMHVDTWGAGFDVWIDGVHFDPQPASGVPELGASVPTALALSAATPNPVRGTTALRLDLPAPSKVAAAVFDIGGRRVRSLVEGSLPVGSHSLTWDRRDASGRSVTAGVYLVRVRAAGREFERKVVVR
jgi:outer membrane protein assembly factor BamB